MEGDLPDPTQIIAATFRRLIPQEVGAADTLARAVVRDLQQNGWLTEWAEIRTLGAMPPNDQMGNSGWWR